MGDKKKLPKGLAEKQDLKRRETINKVLRSVIDIKNDGRKVTISILVEYTGLLRSTFSEPHIREQLVEYGYASGDVAVVPHKRKKAKQDDIIAEKDRQQIAGLKIKNASLNRNASY